MRNIYKIYNYSYEFDNKSKLNLKHQLITLPSDFDHKIDCTFY